MLYSSASVEFGSDNISDIESVKDFSKHWVQQKWHPIDWSVQGCAGLSVGHSHQGWATIRHRLSTDAEHRLISLPKAYRFETIAYNSVLVSFWVILFVKITILRLYYCSVESLAMVAVLGVDSVVNIVNFLHLLGESALVCIHDLQCVPLESLGMT